MTRRMLLAVLSTTLVIGALVAGVAAPAGADAAGNKELARQGLLTPADFPAGWTHTPHSESKPTNLRACRGVAAGVKKNKKYRIESPDFEQGGVTQAQNTIYGFPSVKQAKAFTARYTSGGIDACFEQTVKQAFPDAEISVDRVAAADIPSADLADESFGFIVQLKQKGDSDLEAIYFSALAYRTQQFFDGFTLQNLGAPLPITDSLVEASLTRLTQALPSG